MDPGNLGKVGATEAAQFLKRSGLSDSTLGKVSHSSSASSKLLTSSVNGDTCTVKYAYHSAVEFSIRSYKLNLRFILMCSACSSTLSFLE